MEHIRAHTGSVYHLSTAFFLECHHAVWFYTLFITVDVINRLVFVLETKRSVLWRFLNQELTPIKEINEFVKRYETGTTFLVTALVRLK